MPTAYDMLPDRFADGRHIAIAAGLERAGYAVKKCAGAWAPESRRDVLVTWTRHKGSKDQACTRFEEAGGRIIVAEEAHLRFLPHGPYPNEQYFSLSLNDHQAFWRSYGAERWDGWNIEIQPWRSDGGIVLVREQRGIGSPCGGSPPNWHQETARALRRFTDRKIEVVIHPKTLKREGKPVPAPEAQFADAWCVVTWSSHMGTEALLHGVPVIGRGPNFFLSPACGSRLEEVDAPRRPDNRLAAFRRFAWAQWSMTEIASGEAFKRLLG